MTGAVGAGESTAATAPLDHATQEYLAGIGGRVARTLSTGSLEEVRQCFTELLARNGVGPAMFSVTDATATADGAEHRCGVPLRILAPTAAPLGVVVYFHPGGFVAGSIDGIDTVARKLAERTGYTVVTVSYRLAPEHPVPAAFDDADVAVRWVARERQVWGLGSRPLVVFGEGSGADLAAAAARHATASGAVRPDLQILVGALLDPRAARPGAADQVVGGVVTLTGLQRLADWYDPGDGSAAAARAAPRTDPLSDLPPALIITPCLDPVAEQADAFVARLAGDGAQVVHRRHVGQVRGFFGLLELRYGEKAFSQVVQALYGTSVLRRAGTRHPVDNHRLAHALERLVTA